ncbi:MAG: indolepyruvate ferredoxin oxidoreductase subunit alpha [Ruminococcaceae bacterium]|nr:indolepyruvate ferredoxin oxidoreductase subunit alpha [Oscillospiraceae bacterium]
MAKKTIMLGNEAIARGAYEAGVKLSSAYPGTPSTEISEYLAKYDEIYTEWAPNEKVATEVAIGASFSGVRSLACMKHVGLNVASDPLYTFAYTGVNGGSVIVVADDPGLASSQNEQDTRMVARSAHVPVIEPSDSQEAKDFMKIAYEISEEYDTPVIFRTTTKLAHSQSAVELYDRVEVTDKEYSRNVGKYVMMPASAIARHVVVEARENRLAKDAATLSINKMEMGDTKVGFITSGIAYQYVKEVCPNASVLKLGLVNPISKELIADFCSKVETVYVFEELEPVIEEQVRAWGFDVKGKEVFTRQGEYSANLLKRVLFGNDDCVFEKQESPNRPPILCPGCPHRSVYSVLNKLKIHASGDIGCYTLGAVPPLGVVDTCVCMGASISALHGMEKGKGKDYIKNWVAVIGDSTFLHTGINSLVNMVYNKSTATVMILDNRTTGMTGHQDHAATGKTLKGEETYAIDLAELCRAIGVPNVIEVNAFDVKELERIVKESTQSDELTVIITKAPCVLLKGQKFPSVCKANPEACKKCGMCLKIGCPAITRNQDGTIKIDQTMCNGCGLCKSYCKFNAIETVER